MQILSKEEKHCFHQVLQEFNGLTNEQAYVHVFSKRLMKPIPHQSGEYLGSDQRSDLLPYLQKLVKHLPQKAQIFDVGAGAGDVVDFALKHAPRNTTIHIEEPNSVLIQAYLERLKRYPHLKVGAVYDGIIQNYYQGERIKTFPQQPQHLILAIHMIYHLTDFTQLQINPEEDIIEAITFLYECLAPGGSLFIVYADLLDHTRREAVCGMAEKFFRTHYPDSYFADHLMAIYQARNQLLGPRGTIDHILKQRFPHTQPRLQSEWRRSHFFGESLADIGVLGLATELCSSDREKFDLAKLQFCLDYVANYPESIGLQKEERDIPQKGMWRADEPQIIATITKTMNKN